MGDDLFAATHGSVWFQGAQGPAHPTLEGDRSVDVAVIGAGITGLTTALLLARAGRSVCVVERHTVASGTSGHTTAKVTSQHHLTYASLRATHGSRGAAAYGMAMEAAKEQVASLVGEGIDCDFRRRAAHVYAIRPSEVPILERELRAARHAGLPASLVDAAPVPFTTLASLKFDDQVELHPRKYLLGLAERLVEAGGEIFEHTEALHVDEADGGCTVRTRAGRIRARHVVVATLLPFLDRGGYFARAHATRSYVVTARVRGELPDAMLISAGSPTRSIRAVPFDGEELLMIGGEGHRPGSSAAQPERYDRLAQFAREHWDVVELTHRWSAQDYSPDDGVPYIGRLLGTRHVRVATGFKKWGMTAGTLAGMLLTDDIIGRENPWAPLFSATRLKPLAEAPRFLTENARVGYRFVADRVRERGQRDIGELEPGEGAIVSLHGEKVAGYRDDAGDLHAVSSRCTHLGCQLAWNAAERTWDCPCHASRFDPDGQVLEGPATKPLEVKPTGGTS